MGIGPRTLTGQLTAHPALESPGLPCSATSSFYRDLVNFRQISSEAILHNRPARTSG